MGNLDLGEFVDSLRRTLAAACLGFGIFATACVAGVRPVLATEADMAQLPVSSPNLCLTCHTVQFPSTGNAALNPFGLDFLENGRVWDSNLAQLNSDGDNCLNGVELGDSDGDGQPDGNVTEQSGNPGVADACGSGNLVDQQTWDALKAMFDAH